MKREQVIELAKQAGFGNYAIEAAGIFEKFASLVEQATLERAAQACEQSEAYRGSVFAARIRALKD